MGPKPRAKHTSLPQMQIDFFGLLIGQRGVASQSGRAEGWKGEGSELGLQ
jgi:hypothetical protein